MSALRNVWHLDVNQTSGLPAIRMTPNSTTRKLLYAPNGTPSRPHTRRGGSLFSNISEFLFTFPTATLDSGQIASATHHQQAPKGLAERPGARPTGNKIAGNIGGMAGDSDDTANIAPTALEECDWDGSVNGVGNIACYPDLGY
ncbi:uncharacterized protein LACBIDRAFT_334291 [Laccaria bicolor S238N-H82]|uniref:Predicted protein n=1 Tax=Laccaria bicolor (strain S238N-H82 / ATCC MYA-4686) TaxID=486041 RepID=B0DYR6_LACBS|nr:uncharacterized protein LACBIDRAFT_334291 [Laccaria bicolor S238N-H82]EDR00337.1 predicted protein [Laccaria bicolor S238N-H82]|eukprot:XP_001889089.1 predicted protein [Laccaria bicolor S238N-H82]